jgi:pyruvate formate lyase activating enzyme
VSGLEMENNLEVKGFIPNTMLDWEGMLASTVFLPRCNFRCPYCQNPDLVLHPERLETVPFSVIREFMRERAGWIEGVCITGGEPCLHKDLPDFCSAIKNEGVGVKLDTNGSYPDRLDGLISSGLVDYVAMDVKAPLEPSPYKMASGNDEDDLLDRVRESIEVIRGSGVEHEFRTTAVPMMHGPAEIESIAEYLEGEEKYALQYFSPRETLDPRFSKLKPFTEDDMLAMIEKARKYIPGAAMRGAPAGMDQ